MKHLEILTRDEADILEGAIDDMIRLNESIILGFDNHSNTITDLLYQLGNLQTLKERLRTLW